MDIDPLNQYEWNALLPVPLAAEKLNVTPQELLVMLANQAHRIDGDHPETGKKYPVTLYFRREDLGQPTGISISGRSDWEAKQFIFKLATDGAAELPPSFGHGPLRLEHRDVFLMVYIVRRLRFLKETAPTTSGWVRSPGTREDTTPEAQEARPELKVQTAARRIAEIGEALADRHRQVAPDPAIPAPNQDNQAPGPLLIGTTYYTGRKDIMAALGVSTWKTVKNHMASGLVITHNPAKKPQTTQQEIDRWRASGTGKEKK